MNNQLLNDINEYQRIISDHEQLICFFESLKRDLNLNKWSDRRRHKRYSNIIAGFVGVIEDHQIKILKMKKF